MNITTKVLCDSP